MKVEVIFIPTPPLCDKLQVPHVLKGSQEKKRHCFAQMNAFLNF